MSEGDATHILYYSICAVVRVFITCVRIKEFECAFSFWLKKVPFLALFYTKIEEIEEIESSKNEKKSWKSPGILFGHFGTKPV